MACHGQAGRLGATRSTATSNIPAGYFFNPFAFARPVVLPGQIIPSSGGTAVAGPVAPGSPFGTDFGNVGRNVLRGPRQIKAGKEGQIGSYGLTRLAPTLERESAYEAKLPVLRLADSL